MSGLESDKDGSVWLDPRSQAAKQACLRREKGIVEAKLKALRDQETAISTQSIDLDLRISFAEAYLETIDAKLEALLLWFASPMVRLL